MSLGLLAVAVATGQTKSTYTFKKAGDLEIQADVYRPAGEQRVPVVMWIHGGALIGGHRGNLREFIRIPNGPHGFDGRMQDPQVAATFERSVVFLKAHLK